MIYCQIKIFSVYNNDKYNIIMNYTINKNEYSNIMTRNSCNIKKVVHNKFLSTWMFVCVCVCVYVCYIIHYARIDACMHVRNTYTHINEF